MNRRSAMKAIGLATVNLSMPMMAGAEKPARGELNLYVGTYTSGQSKGIHLFRLKMATGELIPVGLVGETVNPSYLSIDRRGRYLYAVNEVNNFNGQPGGGLTAFAIDRETGSLRELNRQGTKGGSPCYVALHPEGRFALVANYGGGSVAVLPINRDGSLGAAVDVAQHTGSGANPQRQPGPRAHFIMATPDRRRVMAVDLGIDKVMIYRWDGKRGKLLPNDPPFFAARAGAGPRHLDFHPGGRLAYLINELDSTLTACSYDSRSGGLTEVQTVSTLPAGFQGNNTCADLHVHQSGKFVYGSNRGHDSIAAFRIDQSSGRLELIAHEPTQGRNPRNFVIDPTGAFLLAANQSSDSIVVFRIDPGTGKLTPAGKMASVSMPVCLKFV